MKEAGYFHITRSATYGFIAAVPLLIAYEVLILAVNDGTSGSVRVGADVWIKQLIALVGDPGMFAIGLVVMAVGVAVYFRDRKKGMPMRPQYFVWMLAESLLYAVVVAFFVSRVVGALFYNMSLTGVAQDGMESLGLAKMLALSLGAGLYEELVFRVVLVGGLFWLFSKLLGARGGKVISDGESAEGAEGAVGAVTSFSSKVPPYLLAAVVGAVAFSAVHYIGSLGDPFTLSSFTFRFLFGLVLNGLYLTRGFGIAAWTHAIYDVLVVTNTL